MKRLVLVLSPIVLVGCVNINGIRNPIIPYEIGKDMYRVSAGLRSTDDARAGLFLFCDQKERIYKEISMIDGEITFYCLEQGEPSPDVKKPNQRHIRK